MQASLDDLVYTQVGVVGHQIIVIIDYYHGNFIGDFIVRVRFFWYLIAYRARCRHVRFVAIEIFRGVVVQFANLRLLRLI
jgi:hypothetical protein